LLRARKGAFAVYSGVVAVEKRSNYLPHHCENLSVEHCGLQFTAGLPQQEPALHIKTKAMPVFLPTN
jgi:hypothetical protein